MVTNSSNITEHLEKEETISNKGNCLILYNDDRNSFDHVINCLMEICEHDIIQAEQCAYIANYKGKCDIKRGEYQYLKKLKNALIEKGLIVSID